MGPISATPASIYFSSAASFTTPSFSFPDPLSTQCDTAPISGSGCTKFYSLKCYSCFDCSTPTSCSGTCLSPILANFAHSFTITGDSLTLTVAPTTYSYSCFIICSMTTQTQQSSSFTIYASCYAAVLVATTGFLPNFPNVVEMGLTGASSAFTQPDSTYSLSTGS